MKRIIFVLAVMLFVPSLAFALSLTVSAGVTSGTNLGAHVVLECPAATYDPNGDPWDQCSDKGATSSLNFGILTTLLQNPDGTTSGAGCFYGDKFFIVYLFPDAWGGLGYELKQSAATFPPQIQNSVVMTPVYSQYDKYEGATSTQGILNDPALGITGEQLGSAVLARKGGLILRSKRPRIVRAEYGIPPYPAEGEPNPVADAEWKPVALNTPSYTYTSGTITISITPF